MTSRRPAQIRDPRVYPRVCGGTRTLPLANTVQSEVYPRVCGGTHRAGDSRHHLAGSIPACAGEPPILPPAPFEPPVYPRVCGGTLCRRKYPSTRGGLSPRVRGNRVTIRRGRWSEVYPRVCGGTRRSAGLAAANRSIPACAGEPNQAKISVPIGLSPRVRGNPATLQNPNYVRGLSPRVRGNRGSFTASFISGLSPRVRGNPWPGRRCGARASVYPRVCGGTQTSGADWEQPVRGRVYPRVCGGTVMP